MLRLWESGTREMDNERSTQGTSWFYLLSLYASIGQVWSWGDGDYGKLGRGGSDGCKTPKLVEKLQDLDIVKVCCGSQFSVALTKDGQVYTWGKGDNQRLGHGTDEHVRYPKLLDIVDVAVGSTHCLALTDDGEVHSWGKATNGRLGLGLSSGTIPIPRQITALSNYVVKKVAVHSGGRHAMALTVDGKIFSWGEGDDGKLGHFSRMYHVKVNNDYRNCDKPRLIEALKTKRIRDIACGSSHSAAITSSGELYSWGLGEYGSEGCNIPQNIERLNGQGVCQIECGAQFSLALTKSGVVWTW
uniref:RCC1-like domain-containing protein n=1 Tax=Monopterus albus TaxID=43700 RepID=A0A3Q3JYG5_MONAL